MLLSTRLSMLQSREEELQDEVRALNGRISRMDSSSDDVSSLEQKLSECTSELVGVVFVFRNRKSFNSPPPPPPSSFPREKFEKRYKNCLHSSDPDL